MRRKLFGEIQKNCQRRIMHLEMEQDLRSRNKRTNKSENPFIEFSVKNQNLSQSKR